MFWPAPGEPLAEAAPPASDHRLVWVDVALPGHRRLDTARELANFKSMKRIDAIAATRLGGGAPHRGQLAPDRRVRAPAPGRRDHSTTEGRPAPGTRPRRGRPSELQEETHARTHRRPEIVIRAADEDRLAELAERPVRHASRSSAEELLGELARARLASGDAVPADSVQMGSTLTYEADGARRRVTLVYPAEADIDAGRVSVGTPIGTALLGLAEGQSIDWTARDGRRQRLTVVAVERPGAG